MPDTGEKQPIVIICDRLCAHRLNVIKGAKEAGWQPVVFDRHDYAFARLNSDIGALVTTPVIGRRKENIYPPTSLIEMSDQLDVPRGLKAGYPDVYEWIRADSSDIVIPATETYVMDKVSEWLSDLALKTT